MCESQVNPSKVLGVYEEWGWVNVKVYQVYANEFEVNYANASLSEVSASLSEVIQGVVQYCKEVNMTVFFTKKTSFCDFLQVYAHSEQFGLKFTWQMYLQHPTLRSKFEVFTAQPLPKLATATS